MTRVAIATGVYLRLRETQIQNHIHRMFGGNTVVLAAKFGDTPPPDRPHLIWGGRPDLQSQLAAVTNYRKTGTLIVPYGQQRRRIQKFLQVQGIDAILSEFGTEAIRLAPVAEEIGIPLFTMLRGSDASSYLAKPSHIRSYRLALPRMRGVFSVSQFLLDNLARFSLHHENSFVFPSGVDTARFMTDEKTPASCLSVSRLIPKKRLDITIRAFARAIGSAPHATLEIIGDGPLRADLERLVRAEGVGERVVFHGAQPHEFVRDRMATCQIFLQHSMTGPDGDSEGLPTAIQEAMASGMVVLSTRHAGIAEAVDDGRTGFLVEEGDEAAFATVIKNALTDQFSLAAFGHAARRIAVERFDQHTILGNLERAIERLI